MHVLGWFMVWVGWVLEPTWLLYFVGWTGPREAPESTRYTVCAFHIILETVIGSHRFYSVDSGVHPTTAHKGPV